MGETVLRAIGWGAIVLILAIVGAGMARKWGMGVDFANFYDAGQKARAGEFAGLYDSFALIAGHKPLSNMTFFSAPITSFFYAPLAALPPFQALFVFKAIGTLALAAGLVLLYRQSRGLAGEAPLARAWFFALFASAALVFQSFWTIYWVGGQTTPMVFLLLVLAHMAFLRRAFVVTALIFSLVVLIKPVFAPAALLLFLVSSNSFRVTALSCAALSAALSLYLFGWELHREFLSRIADENAILLRPWLNSSPFSWVEPLFVPPEAYRQPSELPVSVRWGQLAARVAVAGALLWAMTRQHRQFDNNVLQRHVVFIAGLFLVIILSPVIWAHYLTVLFIPLAFLIAQRPRLPPGAVVIFATATVFCLFQNLAFVEQAKRIVGFDTRTEILAIGVIKSLPAALFVIGYIYYHAAISQALAASRWSGYGAKDKIGKSVSG